MTQEAVPVDSDLSGVAQTPLWGMGKVIALERPELWGGAIDLSVNSSPEAKARDLLSEIQTSAEDRVALRQGRRYVARLTPSKTKLISSKIAISPDLTYLITGGLGALGLKVAQWLVEKDAKYLVLTSRSGITEQNMDAVALLQEQGAKVMVFQEDVCDRQGMEQMFEKITATLPPLKGIFHAAGIADYCPLTDLDLARFQSVLRPKVTGTWILNQLSQDLNLDYFVNFSSIASIWGSQGQAHYAAANSFLDGMAHYRRSLNKPALSVNWGPWAKGGMAIAEFSDWLKKMGIAPLQPESGLTALEYLLTTNSAQTTVVDVDWQRFKKLYEIKGKRSLLAEIAIEVDNEIQPLTTGKSIILQELETANGNFLQVLIAYLQKETAVVLGLKASQLPDINRGFFDLGMDSLMAVELIKRLEKDLATSLSATLMFEVPTIRKLADYLATEVLNWNKVKKPEISPKTELEQDLKTIEALSDAELEASIRENLAKLEELIAGN